MHDMYPSFVFEEVYREFSWNSDGIWPAGPPPKFRVTLLRCLHPVKVDRSERDRFQRSTSLKREQDIT